MSLRSWVAYVQNLSTRAGARVSRYRQKIVPGREIAESIDIDRLICPLRYDLCVRIDFIRLLRDEWTFYSKDLDGFLGRPESKAYYIWFKEVRCAIYNPDIYRDENLVRSAFAKRVHDTARLWRSIDQSGYDLSAPIRIRTGQSIQAVNGKMINSMYFAGDGCHRMACLYLTGRTRLEPEHYEVCVLRHFVPLDITSVLAERLPLDRTTYLRFISRFYCDGLELGLVGKIHQHVAREKAHLLPELESVLAFDLAKIRDD
jgi:hypothetical protein